MDSFTRPLINEDGIKVKREAMANMKTAMKNYNFVCAKQLLKQIRPSVTYLQRKLAGMY